MCVKYMMIREQLRDYTRELMKQAHEKGTPVMIPLFYEFPEDKVAWETEDQYMYGYKYLCAPILYPGQKKRKVYLPKGKWKAFQAEQEYEGGNTVDVDCPIEMIPVFVKA